MKTTALYPNRLEDKSRVESELRLQEFGDQTTDFYIGEHLFAHGYERIVYGDHGPYVEFSKPQIVAVLKSRFHDYIPKLPPEDESRYYYHWLYPQFDRSIKVYWQIKPVTYLKNAPDREDGKPSQFNREEGYADYRRGYYYVDPFVFLPQDIVGSKNGIRQGYDI